LEKTSIIYY